ncbi:MAG: hypothetical protein JW814_05680 [Candidatus Krumholzibacteriota bacterium]|nr:hypothetical protein [Candidatus Krumholzibacteriota bacterium]
MQTIKWLGSAGFVTLILFTLCGCGDSKSVTSPEENIEPEYSLVFDHEQGDLFYYPRLSNGGRYLAIEREEVIYPTHYASHIWVRDMRTGAARQLTENPADGNHDDRNLRFAEGDTTIYFTRIHWRSDNTYELSLCRVPVAGSEQDVEEVPDGGMMIYHFDFLPGEAGLLVAFYDPDLKVYNMGFLDLNSGIITPINGLNGKRHNCFAPLPDGSGFITSMAAPDVDLSYYKLILFTFDGQTSVEIDFFDTGYITWVISTDPRGERLLVHQGVCRSSLTGYVLLSDGSMTQVLTEYSLPRDAVWGSDDHIYFTVDGNVMRYGPCYP